VRLCCSRIQENIEGEDTQVLELKSRLGERVYLSDLKAKKMDFEVQGAKEDHHWTFAKQCFVEFMMHDVWSINRDIVFQPLIPLRDPATWKQERTAWLQAMVQLKKTANVGALFCLGIRGSSFYKNVFALFKAFSSNECSKNGMSMQCT
jgi:hypothetical protein